MADKRLLDYHIARLQDKNPNVRLKSIQELQLIGDGGALEALQQLFENDPDPEVRRAARDAGRAIFVRQQAQRTV